MRYNTGNPVGPDGSSSPFDLYDNSGIVDLLVNGPLGEYLDRLGVPMKSWRGIMQQVTDYLIAQGYEAIYLAYGPGVVVERQTQLVQRDGELYRVKNATDIPLTLTGTWATDAPKLQAVGDAALRQALASSAGATYVHRGASTVDADLTALENKDVDLQEEIDLLDSRVSALPMVVVQPPSRPAFIDQFVNSFFGRGMLTAEAINTTTERAITASSAAGSNAVTVASSANLVVGGGITIRHADGKYWPYILTNAIGGSLILFPALRAAVDSTCALERTWFNRAHPGKFYMRYLAQRAVYGLESENSMARGKRVAFVEYGSGTTTALGGLAVTTGATVSYFDPSPTGASGTVTTPPRFTFEKTAYVEFSASSTGNAQTGLFALKEYSEVEVVLSMGCDRPVKVAVLNEAGIELAVFIVNPQFIVTNFIGHQRYKFNFYAGNSTSCRFRFEAATANATSMALGSIEAINTQGSQGRLISKDNAVIVGLGDSWMAGDLISTPEREPITQQMALEMPRATIINKGIGGQKIDQMLARFDTDVAPYKPDYVLFITGTNEIYNPLSSTFDPNAINQFIALYWQMIGKIQSIGARPIFIGPPALAQSDADVPALPEWTLLDRSRVQYVRLMRALSDRPNAS